MTSMSDDQDWCRQAEADADSERRFQLRRKASSDQAHWYGFDTALVGLIVIALVTLVCDPTFRLIAVFLFFSCFGIVAWPIGLFSGWFAHRYFFRTMVEPKLIAVAVALMAVLSILGWALVIRAMLPT